MNLFEIVKEKYKDKINSPSKLTKAIKDSDKRLIEQLQQYLDQHKEYQKISYLISAICKDRHPKKCLTCGKQISYQKSLDHDYCCNKCAQTNNNVRKKIENTCIQRYGVKSPTLNQNILLKRENNNLLKYGVKHTRQIKEVDQKIKKTNLQKYGYITPSKNKEIINKIKETNLQKYGVTCTLHNVIIKEKVIQTLIKKYGDIIPLHNKQIIQKKENTCLQKYGVKYPMTNKDVVNNLIKSKITSNYLKDLKIMLFLVLHYKNLMVQNFMILNINGNV